MRRVIVLVLSALVVVSVSLLLLFFRGSADGTLSFEVAKALLQLGVVAVVGAVVSLLIFEYQRERETIDKDRDRNRKSLEYRETLLLSILSRATDAYGRAKKARRLLRGRATVVKDSASAILADQYDRCFDMLNDAQLELEDIARDVETSGKAFSQPKVLIAQLRLMESYLGTLIGEYEKLRRRFSGDPPSLPLRTLSLLKDFLEPANSSDFMPQMVVPYHDVQKRIRGDLLHPNLPGAAGATAIQEVG